MSYEPGPVPSDDKQVREYLSRELRRISNLLKTVVYHQTPFVASLSAGVSANWKLSGGIALLSTSSTITLTGIADTRPHTFVNIGTGVVFFKNEGTESSASYRFALAGNVNLSAGAALSTVYDVRSARHRGLSKT
jgi:hypothetical protein